MFGLRKLRQEVCLRCRYHLTIQSLANARQRGARRFTSHTKSYSSATATYDQSREADRGIDAESPSSYANSFRVGALREGQRRGSISFKHLPLNLNKIALQVQCLGQPAEILRFDPTAKDEKREELYDQWALRNGESNVEEVEDQQDKPEPSSSLSDDLLQNLKHDRKELQEDEIVAAVDSVRDRWLAEINPSNYLTPGECASVCKRLARGFSQKQLSSYLGTTSNLTAEDYDDLQGFHKSQWCIRSAWYSGEPNPRSPGSIIQSFLLDRTPQHPSLFHGKLNHQKDSEPESVNFKRRVILVERILRNSWHLRTFDELQTVGEVDVRLDPKRCMLLQRFDVFAELERRLDVKITVHPDNKALRIRGSHEQCALAFAGIYAPIQTVERKKINLMGMAGGKRTWDFLLKSHPQLLTAIAEASKVHIEHDSVEKLLLDVWFLSPSRADEEARDSSAYDNALRMFKEIHESVHRPLSLLPPSIEQTAITPLAITDSLPLQLRQQSWSRRTDLNVRKSRPLAEQDLKTADATALILSLSDRLLKSYREHQRVPTSDAPLSRHWQREPVREVLLQTGFAAFEPSSKKRSSMVASQDQESLELRTFAYSVPGGPSMLERLIEGGQTVGDSIVLRLEPQRVHPNKKQWKEKILPDLEIRLTPNDSDRGFHSASPLFSLRGSRVQVAAPSARSDALLSSNSIVRPDQDVDVDIQDWIGNIHAVDGNIVENTVPGTLTLDVPLQATTVRSDFMNEVNQFVQERKQRGLDTIFRPGGGEVSSTVVPDDTNMRRASASDLLISSEDTEYYLSTQPVAKSGKTDEEYEKAFLDSYEQEDPIDDESIDSAFEKVPKDHVPEDRPLGPGGKRSNINSDPVEPLSDPNVLFGKDMKYRGALLLESTVRATYKFVGLEYHSNLHAKYQGFELTYSIVDAGDDGGRFERLALKAPEAGTDDANAPSTDDGANDAELEAEKAQHKLRQRRREKVIRSDSTLRSLEDDKEVHQLADWLEKALGMIVKLDASSTEHDASTKGQTS